MGTLEDLFDPERLRKKWVAEPESAQPVIHEKLLDVQPAFDLSGSAAELLRRIRAIAALRFPSHRQALEPFFQRAFKEVEALAVPDPPKEAREELQRIITDIQELLEAWILTER